jgi:excinuclease UvrABC nuclease subunit
MVLPEPLIHDPSAAGDGLPQTPAVYLLWPQQGEPYLGRTSVLGRRITRLVGKWNLAGTLRRIEYWPVGSKLEQWLVSYELARRHFPETYERQLRLPRPSYVRLIQSNRFPRTMITSRLTGGRNLYYGPFPSRALADQFESQFLDLFQLRRCQEDLVPSPDHPGCIYGEMNMCLRPCQDAVSDGEYLSESARVADFLQGQGATLKAAAESARDRLSQEMMFEEAARQHGRMEKIEAIVKLPGDLAREVNQLNGVAVTRSAEEQAVELWFLMTGCWTSPRRLSLAPDQNLSLDKRIREITAGLEPPDLKRREDHLSLLAKWYFSSWRDGEWLACETLEKMSYRKLVNAIHRVATGTR